MGPEGGIRAACVVGRCAGKVWASRGMWGALKGWGGAVGPRREIWGSGVGPGCSVGCSVVGTAHAVGRHCRAGRVINVISAWHVQCPPHLCAFTRLFPAVPPHTPCLPPRACRPHFLLFLRKIRGYSPSHPILPTVGTPPHQDPISPTVPLPTPPHGGAVLSPQEVEFLSSSITQLKVVQTKYVEAKDCLNVLNKSNEGKWDS